MHDQALGLGERNRTSTSNGRTLAITRQNKNSTGHKLQCLLCVSRLPHHPATCNRVCRLNTMAAPPQCAASADDPTSIVLSDVHVETCPPGKGPWLTRFYFREPEAACGTPTDSSQQTSSSTASIDDNGDLVLVRPARVERYLQIQHALATPISSCGEQVWLGSLLLADHLLSNPQLLKGATVLELGAGVGLAGLMAARTARRVILTDSDESALALAAANVGSNSAEVHASVSLRKLNWFDLLGVAAELTESELLQQLQGGGVPDSTTNGDGTADRACSSRAHTPSVNNSHSAHSSGDPLSSVADSHLGRPSSFDWRPEDLEVLADMDLLLAADVVYDETLTEALMHTARCLMAWAHNKKRPGAAQNQPQCSMSASTAAASMVAGDSEASTMAQHTHTASGASGERSRVKMLVALERRYTFTLRDMDSRAPAFEHFLTFVAEADTDVGRLPRMQQAGTNTATNSSTQSSGVTEKKLFMGKRLPVQQMPQLVQYDRSPELELWELWLPS